MEKKQKGRALSFFFIKRVLEYPQKMEASYGGVEVGGGVVAAAVAAAVIVGNVLSFHVLFPLVFLLLFIASYVHPANFICTPTQKK